MSEKVCTCIAGGRAAAQVKGCQLHDVTQPSVLDDLLSSEKQQANMEAQMSERCVFSVGEILLIRGGFFKVHAITTKRMYLDFCGEAKEVLKKP